MKKKSKTQDPNELIPIAVYNDRYQIEILKGFLAESGLTSIIMDHHIENTEAILPIRLAVKHSDLERARELLIEYEKLSKQDGKGFDWGEIDPTWADDALPDEDASATPNRYTWSTCPQCASKNTNIQPMDRKKVGWSLLLLGIPLLFMSRSMACKNCGHCWNI